MNQSGRTVTDIIVAWETARHSLSCRRDRDSFPSLYRTRRHEECRATSAVDSRACLTWAARKRTEDSQGDGRPQQVGRSHLSPATANAQDRFRIYLLDQERTGRMALRRS